MTVKLLSAAFILILSSAPMLAETKSDFDRSFDFASLKTWDFKSQKRMPEDPVGTNNLWDQRIRDGLRQRLTAGGFEIVSQGQPSFLVAYYIGTKERYDIRYVQYGFPGRWGGWRRWGWRGWGPGWRGPADVWKIPYTESTMVLDIIDPKSNQLVWRGYDTETIDFNKSEKSIAKSVDKLVKRFMHDAKKSERM